MWGRTKEARAKPNGQRGSLYTTITVCFVSEKKKKNKNDVVKQRERTNELKMEPVTG
jgi:hypothetical protein